MKTIKGIIFDLDGTLLNTIEDIKESCNRSLEEHGLRPYDSSAYKKMVGDGVDQLIVRCLENQNRSIALFESVKKRYLDFYQMLSKGHTEIYDGILELLAFAKANQISCNVLSNKPHLDTVDVILHYFGEDTFTKIYGKKPGFPPKPDPRLLNELILELKINKENILYIGDTLTDMETAINGGLSKVGVLWGFRDKEELESAHPEYIVSHPSEIIKIIKEGLK